MITKECEMNEILQTHLQRKFNLSAKELGEITTYFKPLILGVGQHFLVEGKVSDSMAFTVKGVIRTYYVDDNAHDITTYFFKENQFFGNLYSYANNHPSDFNIQAITRCELLIIKKTDAEKLGGIIPVWTKIFNLLIQNTLLQKIANQNEIRVSTAKEKYQTFLEKNGDIVARVPLQFIASYLGITPQSLSRIRRISN